MQESRDGSAAESGNLRAVIVDDERRSRETLQKLLEMYDSGIDVVAMGDSVQEGCRVIELHVPDLVFLDIELPDGDGFDILGNFGGRTFDVIIVSAYARYKTKAEEFAPCDYLLKPVSIRELQAVVEGVRRRRLA